MPVHGFYSAACATDSPMRALIHRSEYNSLVALYRSEYNSLVDLYRSEYNNLVGLHRHGGGGVGWRWGVRGVDRHSLDLK